MKENCLINFKLLIILVGLCMKYTISNPLGPSLQDLENQKCPSQKPLLCIPYGACCSHSEFCHAGLCESCFHDNVMNDLLDWCRKTGQFNMSLMRSNSCRFACHAQFTPEQLMPIKENEAQPLKDEKSLRSLDQMQTPTINTVEILTLVIVFILLFAKIIPKLWHHLTLKVKFKCPILKRTAKDADFTQNKKCDHHTKIEEFDSTSSPNANENLSDAKQADKSLNVVGAASNRDSKGKSHANYKNKLNGKLIEDEIEEDSIDLENKPRGNDMDIKDQKLGFFKRPPVTGCGAEEGSSSSTPLLSITTTDSAMATKPLSQNEMEDRRFNYSEIYTSTTDLTCSPCYQQQGLTGINGYKKPQRSSEKPPDKKSNKTGKPILETISGAEGGWDDYIHVHRVDSNSSSLADDEDFLNPDKGALNYSPTSNGHSYNIGNYHGDLTTSHSSLDSSRPGYYANRIVDFKQAKQITF
ncbi:hypothetical protein Btru_030542 [Bulinus truncatus]|nr:hypothetical protein Btru_030542 [Bulinus truncatus]